MKGHQPESLDWFNVLIAQTIAQLRADARQDGAVLTSLTELLNAGSKPDWIGEIKVTEIALGDEFPIFSNCRVMPADDGFLSSGGGTSSGGIPGTEEGRLQARMDVDLSDVITLGIETTLVLNYPKPFVAVLPVALAVSVVRFSGTLAVSFIPSSSPPSTSANNPAEDASRPSSSRKRAVSPPPSTPASTPRRPTTLAFTFLDDYRLDLSVRSLVGSRSRLQDVPKIAQLIESRVHAWFDERAVEPRFQQIVLPSLWPRKKNTRGGEDTAPDEHDSADSGVDVTEGFGGVPSLSEAVLPEQVERGGPGAARGSRHHSTAAETLEARIEAEGAKLREAERRAGERSRSREVGEGIRWRSEHLREQGRRASRMGGEWAAQGGMPGAMPGG